jgi:hypothetical protein
MFKKIEDLMVGLVGRPVLWLIKFMGPMWLLAGIAYTEVVAIDPKTGMEVSSHHDFMSVIVGVILFCIARTIKRYDDALK